MANENVLSTQNGAPAGRGAERYDRRLQTPPPVDIYENNEEILVVADVPGAESNGVTIRLEKDELTLTARRPEPPKGQIVSGSAATPDYARTFIVPRGIDPEKIAAEMKDGVLTIHLPKSEAVKPRKIAVRAS